MKTYTTADVAAATGKTAQAISRYAQAHPGIGRKAGRDWLFTEAEYRRLLAVKPGRPRKRRGSAGSPTGAKPAPAPASTSSATAAQEAA
jgi:hypothetical protein